MIFTQALIAGLCIASLSFLGILFFGKNERFARSHIFMLPMAVGVFLGVVFFELIPETLELSPLWGPLVVVTGFLSFYLLSYILDTFHHHHAEESHTCIHDNVRMLLIGDTIHNIADGIVLTSAFMLNPLLGIVTTLGIALHEAPQKIAEYGVLVHSGCSQKRATGYTFLSSLSVIVGIVLTYIFAHSFASYTFVLTGIAAGNLLYIATTDLIPELQNSHKDHFKTTFMATLLGLLIIGGLITFTHSFTEQLESNATVQTSVQ